jgi:two-component system response regulator HydG
MDLSLKAVLAEEGFTVADAPDGTKALELVSQQFFDIMLIDYRLPDMTGLDLIKQALVISKDSIPVIVTGCISIEIAVESMRCGTHDYLIKPVNIDELKKNLLNILDERAEIKEGKQKFQQAIQKLQFSDANAVVRLLADNKEC